MEKVNRVELKSWVDTGAARNLVNAGLRRWNNGELPPREFALSAVNGMKLCARKVVALELDKVVH